LLLTAAYLVRHHRLDPFRGRVRTLSTDYPALRFLCTGPWPPYSFVTDCVPLEGERELRHAHRRR
jgi:hypothetical protein